MNIDLWDVTQFGKTRLPYIEQTINIVKLRKVNIFRIVKNEFIAAITQLNKRKRL